MAIRSISAAAALLFALAGTAHAANPDPERWIDISPETLNSGEIRLPVGELDGAEGPSVLRVQLLLNRALFSPGMLDARWGANVRTATRWFQKREGLEETGVVDEATYDALMRASGRPDRLVRQHTLSATDVEGPFVALPSNMYERAKLACSCYQMLSEKIAEQFHTREGVLERLNPGTNLDSLKAGDKLWVPRVREPTVAANMKIAEILVSGSGNFVQARDSAGNILAHFASTMGSSIDPSPEGEVTVREVTANPWWNYQPALLKVLRSSGPNAMIPPGPNNAVGWVWIGLSAPHYGIHGTSEPETIGYATSSGCVRLPNWDARFLSRRVRPGTRVRFEDTRNGERVIPRRPRPRLLGTRADSVAPEPR
ncbi:MAG TPA: L,D-transpeptidase family protein [Longimicrobium sp.]|jgi:lipoprotein-anchoring transpeptidase ErfK/SrfK